MQAKVSLSISYQKQENGPAFVWTPNPKPVIPYETIHDQALGIADGENSGFEFDLDTGDICGVKLAAWQNKTGQECNWEINGDSDYSFEPDDVVLITAKTNDADSTIWSVAIYTLDTQVGAGSISALTAGDTW